MMERVKFGDDIVASDKDIAGLVDALASVDGGERRTARIQLEETGRAAVPALVKALQSPNDHVRWEAAKALGELPDPAAAPALAHTLEDEKAGIRWLAATALISLGRDALMPLLQGLENNSDSLWFREGAHHVLRTLVKDGAADEAVPVLEALEDIEPCIEAPVAAYNVLQDLRWGRKAGA